MNVPPERPPLVACPDRRGGTGARGDPGLRLAQVAYAALVDDGREGHVKISMSGARKVRGVETCWSEPRNTGPLADQIAAVTANAPTGCDLSITLRTPDHPHDHGRLDIRLYQAVAQ